MSLKRLILSRLRSWIITAAVLILALSATQPAQAEGSADLLDSGGRRVYLLYANSQTGNIDDRTIFKVYAEVGEVINMGSSANGRGAGIIRYHAPDAPFPTWQQCATNVGIIQNRTQEINGPFAGGYTPCTVTVGAGQGGVWLVEFFSPNPAQVDLPGPGDFFNPPVELVNNPWDLADPDPEGQPTTVRWIRAWDVTVTDGGLEAPGRVYADHLPLNVGNNLTGQDVISADLYIMTEDGFGYNVDMNGIDPFGFQFLSNNKGIRDASGYPIFRSLQFQGPNSNQVIPPGYSVHDPVTPDNPGSNDYTHKVFYNTPDFAAFALLPGTLNSAPSALGTINFSEPVEPPVPTTLTFTGGEGTPGNAGTAPLVGIFSFDAVQEASFAITIDIDRNGVYGDPIDRILVGYALIGLNTVEWDGIDGLGDPAPAGNFSYDAQLEFFGGEVHFPFFDPENNISGIIIERVRDPGTTLPVPDEFRVKYDDTYNYDGVVTYDYSLCSINDVPPPPGGSGVNAPECYGIPPVVRSALGGISSAGGAHEWSSDVVNIVSEAGFGNRRGMDTWANYPSDGLIVTDIVTLREADLIMDKTHQPEPVSPGGPITFILNVSNAGPNDADGATVSDTMPVEIQNVTWSCQGFNGAVCSTPSTGTGNIVNYVLQTFPVGSYVEFTIDANIDPAIVPPFSFSNSATVLRPDDVTDPTDPDRLGLGNNTDDDVVNVDVATATPTLTPSLTPTPTLTPSNTLTNTPTNTPGGPTPTETTGPCPIMPPQNRLGSSRQEGASLDNRAGGNNFDSAPRYCYTMTPSPTVTNTPNIPELTATSGGATLTPTTVVINPTAAIADPVITKSVNPPFAQPGELVTWTITVHNPGTVPVTNIRVVDTMPSEVEILSVSASAGTVSFSGQVVNFAMDVLNAGASVTITIVTRVRLDVELPFVINNLAVLTGDGFPPKTAQAVVSSAATLPNTGEMPDFRWIVFTGGLIAIGTGWLLRRKARAI